VKAPFDLCTGATFAALAGYKVKICIILNTSDEASSPNIASLSQRDAKAAKLLLATEESQNSSTLRIFHIHGTLFSEG